jgi:regulatory LuxR family protein
MGHSQALRLREIRSVFHLLAEITERGIDPHAWREQMLRGLCQLTGARLGISMGLRNAFPGKALIPLEPMAVGFTSDHELALWSRYLESSEIGEDPATHALLELQRKRRFFLKRREEMVDSKRWYASPVVMESRRPAGVDDYLMASARALRPGVVLGFALYRPWGEKPFGVREQRIARLFHVELLQMLWPISESTDPAYLALPHRLRLTLRSLLRGKTSKEMARELGLTVQTVETYVKDLYARMRVESRGELMSRFLNRAGGRAGVFAGGAGGVRGADQARGEGLAILPHSGHLSGVSRRS